MIPRELIQKIRQIEIHTKRLVNDIMAGEYHSVFKGRGMEFSEVREYQVGDDIRTIDWNVTARTGKPHVKQFVEERELTVMLLVDVSSSGEFGTQQQMKNEISAEISALLAFSAIKNNDRVGLLIFTDEVEKFVPPKKGRTHVLRVIREILYFKPQKKETDIKNALDYLNRVMNRKTVVFLISDFLSSNYDKPLQIANKKHDIIAITITDPREIELPTLGFLQLEDAETGENLFIDTYDRGVREWFHQFSTDDSKGRNNLFKSMDVDYVDVITDKPYIDPLVKLFRKRAKRLR
jgi:uncharacterized protein (DUF58 family)